jgi:carboxymethylenebutenolidase
MRYLWFRRYAKAIFPVPAGPRELAGMSDLSRRSLLTAGIGLLAALIAARQSGALAATPAEPDPASSRSATETVVYPGRKTPLKAYMARPKNAAGKRPGVVIIHEIRGLNGHFRDLARRLAQEGMIAMVPDLASGQGFAQEGSDEVRDYLQKLAVADVTAEYQAAIEYLRSQPDCSGAIGVIGFAWGGVVAADLAAQPSKPVKAAVMYYSLPANLDVVPKFAAAVQLHYAEQDPHTQPQIEPIEKRLIGHSKIYEQYVYEGAKQNFANESLPKWYNKAEATLAWDRTVMFLKRQLGSEPPAKPGN